MLLSRIVNSPLMRDKNDIAVIAPLLSAGEAGLLTAKLGRQEAGFFAGEAGSPVESV